jgi:hypothetical protein
MPNRIEAANYTPLTLALAGNQTNAKGFIENCPVNS